MNLYFVEFVFDVKECDKPDGKYVVADNMAVVENHYPNLDSVELSEKNIDILTKLSKT